MGSGCGREKEASGGHAGRKAGQAEAISRSWSADGLQGSLRDQAGEIESQGEGVRDDHRFGGVVEAEPGGALDAAALLDGISALGVALTSDAQLPGIGTDLEIAGQADAAIWEGKAGGEGITEGMIRFSKLAGLSGSVSRWLLRQRKSNVRGSLVVAFLAADPFRCIVLVIVAIGEEAVAQRAEGIAVLVIAALETGERLVIAIHV